MNLTDPNVIRPLLKKNNFHFSKAKGQNFLIADWVPEQIMEAAGLSKKDGVLEIGPGIGTLTQYLSKKAGKVLAVEADSTLRPILKETLADTQNVEILFSDILRQNIPELIQTYLAGFTPVAVANLPYNITTPVLTALLQPRCFASITVMVQKEVAQRICAGPGTKACSAFSIFCRYYADPEIQFEVPPNCFMPRPQVTSAVVHFTCHKDAPDFVHDERLFFRVVRAAFAQRRKTLPNALSSGFPGIPKDRLKDAVRQTGFPETIRGEALDIEDFARLADILAQELPAFQLNNDANFAIHHKEKADLF